jgi:hypothetical protein
MTDAFVIDQVSWHTQTRGNNETSVETHRRLLRLYSFCKVGA